MPKRVDRNTGDPAIQKGWVLRAWKESHGNWLLVFAAVIFLAGLAVIWTRPPAPEGPDLGEAMASEEDAEPLPENAILVRVSTDSENVTGPIRIAIYDSAEAFGNPDKAVVKDSLVPVDKLVIWEIDLDFLPNSFSVAAYHDLDDNGELNRGLFNAPTEPFGFSNNARSLYGPPTYEQTVINKPSDSSVLDVRVYN